MLNNQPPMKMSESADLIAVHTIWETLQGEGPFVGCPALFVRLVGCNLQCPNCDTLYLANSTTEGFVTETMAAAEIIHRRAMKASRDIRMPSLIVITGGEPFRQPSTIALALELIEYGNIVQIETNGTIARPWQADHHGLTIVISPKGSNVHESWLNGAQGNLHWKYVGGADELDPADGLPLGVLGYKTRPTRPPGRCYLQGHVYLQPEDSKDPTENKRNEEAVVASCLKFGYRFTPQLHKMLNLP